MNKWEDLTHADKVREITVARAVDIIDVVLTVVAGVTFILLSSGDSRVTVAVLVLLVPSFAIGVERCGWIRGLLHAVRNNNL